MKELEFSGIKIDACLQCGAVWFDAFELQKFDEVSESAGDQLVSVLEGARKGSFEKNDRIRCPRHNDIPMMRHFYSAKRKIEIDECPQCGGVWFDMGELAELRRLFPTEAERTKAGHAYVEEILNSSEMKEMKRQSQEDLKKAQRFVRLFRFLCPSYYLPGKQEGAAF